MLTADEMGLEGECYQLGDLPTGSACGEDDDPNDLAPENRCAGFHCLRDHCTEVCAQSEDCPQDMVCGDWAFQVDDAGAAFASIGMCLWMPGSKTACSSDLDCPAGEVCDHYYLPGGVQTRVCTTRRCDPAEDGCAGFGEPCGLGMARCASWLCLPVPPEEQGVCSSLCDPNVGCPDGASCGLEYLPGYEMPIWACR